MRSSNMRQQIPQSLKCRPAASNSSVARLLDWYFLIHSSSKCACSIIPFCDPVLIVPPFPIPSRGGSSCLPFGKKTDPGGGYAHEYKEKSHFAFQHSFQSFPCLVSISDDLVASNLQHYANHVIFEREVFPEEQKPAAAPALDRRIFRDGE